MLNRLGVDPDDPRAGGVRRNRVGAGDYGVHLHRVALPGALPLLPVEAVDDCQRRREGAADVVDHLVRALSVEPELVFRGEHPEHVLEAHGDGRVVEGLHRRGADYRRLCGHLGDLEALHGPGLLHGEFDLLLQATHVDVLGSEAVYDFHHPGLDHRLVRRGDPSLGLHDDGPLPQVHHPVEDRLDHDGVRRDTRLIRVGRDQVDLDENRVPPLQCLPVRNEVEGTVDGLQPPLSLNNSHNRSHSNRYTSAT